VGHPACGLDMKRLSCVFCVFAPRQQLLIAARHNPRLASRYAAVERHIGHQFTAAVSIAEIAVEATAAPDRSAA